MRTEIVRYVLHEDVEKWEALGWEHSDPLDGTPHGEWSVLMVWRRLEPAKYPARTIFWDDYGNGDD